MRLTKKKENGFHELKEGQEIYGEESGIRLVQIVGQLEDIMEKYDINSAEELEHIILNNATGEQSFNDYIKPYKNIEEELGIDLITLFKADNDGAYYKEDLRHYIAYVDLKHKCIRLVSHHEADDDFDVHYVMFKDYGKTWALTKEELE